MDTSYKLKVVQTYGGEGEKIKLKNTCPTKDAGPVFSYLTAEKGKVTIVVDYSQDEFGPNKVYTYQCSELEFGVFFDSREAKKFGFQKTDKTDVKDAVPVLRCVADRREVFF